MIIFVYQSYLQQLYDKNQQSPEVVIPNIIAKNFESAQRNNSTLNVWVKRPIVSVYMTNELNNNVYV